MGARRQGALRRSTSSGHATSLRVSRAISNASLQARSAVAAPRLQITQLLLDQLTDRDVLTLRWVIRVVEDVAHAPPRMPADLADQDIGLPLEAPGHLPRRLRAGTEVSGLSSVGSCACTSSETCGAVAR